MNEIRHILAACAVTEDCSDILRFASALSRSMRARMTILTVVYNPFGEKGLSFPRPSLQKDLNLLVEKTSKQIRTVIAREELHGVIIEHVIREGKPVKVITDIVLEQKIDLLVLPAHRQTRLEQFLSGLTGGYNKAVLRKLPCSLLFLKKEPAAVEQADEREEEWGVDKRTRKAA